MLEWTRGLDVRLLNELMQSKLAIPLLLNGRKQRHGKLPRRSRRQRFFSEFPRLFLMQHRGIRTIGNRFSWIFNDCSFLSRNRLVIRVAGISVDSGNLNEFVCVSVVLHVNYRHEEECYNKEYSCKNNYRERSVYLPCCWFEGVTQRRL